MGVEESRASYENLFVGGGELGALLRAHNWSQTSLGTVETWSDDLKMTVQTLLTELDKAKLPEKTQLDSKELQNGSESAALHQANELNAFRVKLADALRSLTDAEEIQAVAARILGESLGATRVIYIEVVSGGEEVIVHCNYTNGVAQLSGRYCLEDYRRNLAVDHQTGRTQVVTDIPNNPKYTVNEKARYREIDIAAHIDVPLVKNNQFVALLAVQQSTPRTWTETEVKLVEETASRTWADVERARVEGALRESEQRFRLMADAVPQIVWMTDAQGRVEFFNKQWSNYTGVSYEPTTVAEVAASFIHPEDGDRTVAAFNEARHSGAIFLVEHRIRSVAGTYRWFLVRGEPYRDPQTGEIVRWFGASVDIHERKTAEQLAAADFNDMQRLHDLSTRLIFEDNVQVLYDEIVAAAISIMQADAGTIQLLDTQTNELIILAMQGLEKKLTDYFERLNASCGTSCGIALAQGVRTFVDFDAPGVPDPDGSLKIHLDAGLRTAQSTPLITRSGRVIGMLSTHWRNHHRPTERELRFLDLLTRQAADLIERRQTEAALRDSEELKERILESSKDCIKVLTLNSEIVYINTGGLCLLEIDDPTLVLNTCWLNFWQSEDYENAKTALTAAREGSTGQFQGYLPTHKGTPKWWDIIITPVRNSAGQITQLLTVSRDITKQKQAETERETLLAIEQDAREQAETANRIKDQFLAVLSHELRSPLNPILGWTRLLQNSKLDAARQKVALATIERNAKLQTQLIEDFLDISRIMQGKLSLTVAPVSLDFVISAALETVRLAAEAKKIQISLDIAPTVAPVSGDAARLQQVVWNLLTNAVKFTPNNGQVTVELHELDKKAQIRVIDTGIGINPQFLPYVFEYFRQEDGSTTRKFGGLGLGLAIVRQIVEMHGGTVQAESQGEGQGATFIVQLPTVQQTLPVVSQPIQTQADTELPLAGVQILLVDDEPDTREFQAFVLSQSGASVTAVASGLEALQALEQFIPDVLVSDIGMPQMDGYMLIGQIRSRPPNQGGTIPAIALTAYAGEIDQQRVLQAGFQAHITKPVAPEELVRVIVDRNKYKLGAT